MNSIRFTRFAVSLGMACLTLTGNALAGTTVATDVTYAQEVGAAGTAYLLPMANTVARTMNVLRGVGGDFFVDVTL